MSSHTYPQVLHSRRPHRRGFSLIELAVVLVVIAVIAAIAIPTFKTVITRSQDHATLTTMNALVRNASAIAAFDGRDTYLLDDVETAVSELSAAAAPGVTASSTWHLVEDHSAEYGEIHAGIINTGDILGVAARSVGDSCVYVRASVGATSESFIVGDVPDEDCSAEAALAHEGGPLDPGGPGDPGDPGDPGGPSDPGVEVDEATIDACLVGLHAAYDAEKGLPANEGMTGLQLFNQLVAGSSISDCEDVEVGLVPGGDTAADDDLEFATIHAYGSSAALCRSLMFIVGMNVDMCPPEMLPTGDRIPASIDLSTAPYTNPFTVSDMGHEAGMTWVVTDGGELLYWGWDADLGFPNATGLTRVGTASNWKAVSVIDGWPDAALIVSLLNTAGDAYTLEYEWDGALLEAVEVIHPNNVAWDDVGSYFLDVNGDLYHPGGNLKQILPMDCCAQTHNFDGPVRVGRGDVTWAGVGPHGAYTTEGHVYSKHDWIGNSVAEGAGMAWANGRAGVSQTGVVYYPSWVDCPDAPAGYNCVYDTVYDDTRLWADFIWGLYPEYGEPEFGIAQDGTLWAKGPNDEGILGLGDTAPSYVNSWTQIGTGSNWERFWSEYDTFYATTTSGELYAWGHNPDGSEIPGNPNEIVTSPVRIGG